MLTIYACDDSLNYECFANQAYTKQFKPASYLSYHNLIIIAHLIAYFDIVFLLKINLPIFLFLTYPCNQLLVDNSPTLKVKAYWVLRYPNPSKKGVGMRHKVN